MNEIPRIRDRSDSFWRRVAVVYFQKCFTGVERSEIKHDYIARKEVLEYVQMRALSMDIDKLEPPAACEYMLDEFKAESNPVLQFALDVLPRAR